MTDFQPGDWVRHRDGREGVLMCRSPDRHGEVRVCQPDLTLIRLANGLPPDLEAALRDWADEVESDGAFMTAPRELWLFCAIRDYLPPLTPAQRLASLIERDGSEEMRTLWAEAQKEIVK